MTQINSVYEHLLRQPNRRKPKKNMNYKNVTITQGAIASSNGGSEHKCNCDEGACSCMKGKGWKGATGKSLIGLAALGAAGNMQSGKFIEGALGGAVLGGLGGLLLHLDKKKGSGYQAGSGKSHDVFKAHSLKHLRQKLGKTKKHALEFMEKHANTAISISDMFGTDWQSKGQKLIESLEKAKKNRPTQGDGINLKKTFNSAKRKMKQFVAGKTKLKPSQLVSYMSSAVGLAGTVSAFVPGVNILSVPTAAATTLGLKAVSNALKTSGRGISDLVDYSELGLEGFEDPGKIGQAIAQLAKSAGPQLSKSKLGLAIGVSGAALATVYIAYKKIRKYIRKQKGGMKVPKKVITYIKSNPAMAKKMAKKLKGGQCGRGFKTFARTSGLLTIGASVGAAGLYQYMRTNPAFTAKLAAKGAKGIAEAWLDGRGLAEDINAKSAGPKAKPIGYWDYLLRTKDNVRDPEGYAQALAYQKENPSVGKGLKLAGGSTKKTKRKGNGLVPTGGALLLSGEGLSVRKVGSKRDVFLGFASRTAGGLHKSDLVKNKRGKIVSLKQQAAGRASFAKNNLKQFKNNL
jgi:hypothetical protein